MNADKLVRGLNQSYSSRVIIRELTNLQQINMLRRLEYTRPYHLVKLSQKVSICFFVNCTVLKKITEFYLIGLYNIYLLV
jgi:hypothetical protein